MIDIPPDNKIKMHTISEIKADIHSVVDNNIVMENRKSQNFNTEVNNDDIFKDKNKFFIEQESNMEIEMTENEPIECQIVNASMVGEDGLRKPKKTNQRKINSSSRIGGNSCKSRKCFGR